MRSVNNIYSYSAQLMGSPVLLKMFVHDETVARRVFHCIKQLEDVLTVNRQHSEVMKINNAAGKGYVAVSPAVFQLIKQAKAISLIKGSCFNLAIGPVVKLWKIGFKGCAVPDAATIENALELTNPARVMLNDDECAVFLKTEGMEIDLGAIAKGYIADVIRDLLYQHNIHHAVINLGGNVLAIGCSLTDARGQWSVGLQKPFADRDCLLGIIKVKNQSVVTSGVYERFFTVDDRVYHHILNPRTGYPLNNSLHSVTIISDKSIDGDIYSTLMYGMDVEAGIKYLMARPGIDAIFVTKNKEIILSSQRHYDFELLDCTYSLICTDGQGRV
ncbi:thiamine biosynthesis protein ApbE [Brenneria alni]|uniref:FAD:protein FMN transferase n=1 Tax=Brenneria alni TaxID=71656 RepID=A0A421DRG5_9GAMM|nr:FAD:protein FMN transferase [Brenneria alni]RLM26563.1 thiamine biosynthesis protein ApbE [Brenneria alni]